MIQTIKLTGLSAFGYHGVFDFEREKGQPFILNAEIEFDAAGAIRDDDLTKTLNYARLGEFLKGQIESEPVDLLETLVARVATALMDFDNLIISVFVEIAKPEAPMDQSLGTVSVSTRMSRG